MSGYLNRLVARARGTLPVIQPLVPSRFAAVQEFGDMGWAETETAPAVMEHERHTETSRRADSPEGARRPEATKQPLYPAQRQHGNAELPYPIPQPQRANPDVAPPNAPQPAIAPNITEVVAGKLRQDPAQPIRPTPRVLSPADQGTRVEEPQRRHTSVIQQTTPGPRPEPARLAEAEAARFHAGRAADTRSAIPAAPPQRVADRGVTQAEASIPTHPSPTLVAPAASPSDRPLQPPREPELPPIRVTIGRIEVHAELAQPPMPHKPAAAPAKPRLSLEEYLNRRAGGRP